MTANDGGAACCSRHLAPSMHTAVRSNGERSGLDSVFSMNHSAYRRHGIAQGTLRSSELQAVALCDCRQCQLT